MTGAAGQRMHAWPPEMFRSRQRGWIALPDRALRAKGDDIPHGVSVGPARAVDTARGCRWAEDTDTVRRNPGLPLLPGTSNLEQVVSSPLPSQRPPLAAWLIFA